MINLLKTNAEESLTFKKGFTLVEMLVVIAVITILSTIIFASFSESKMKARDTARSSDIEQLKAALQVYAVTYGSYPTSLNALVTAGLIQSVPTDPLNSGVNVYTYQNSCATPNVTNNTQYYRLWTIGEREQGATASGWTDSKTIGATVCTDPQ